MRLVCVESPLAGDFALNLRYARLCMLDCLLKGEAPYASHLLYPQCLEDRDPSERKLGMEAGFAFKRVVEATVVYTDRGLSEGMKKGIELSEQLGHTVEYRQLPADLMALLLDSQELGTRV